MRNKHYNNRRRRLVKRSYTRHIIYQLWNRDKGRHFYAFNGLAGVFLSDHVSEFRDGYEMHCDELTVFYAAHKIAKKLCAFFIALWNAYWYDNYLFTFMLFKCHSWYGSNQNVKPFVMVKPVFAVIFIVGQSIFVKYFTPRHFELILFIYLRIWLQYEIHFEFKVPVIVSDIWRPWPAGSFALIKIQIYKLNDDNLQKLK